MRVLVMLHLEKMHQKMMMLIPTGCYQVEISPILNSRILKFQMYSWYISFFHTNPQTCLNRKMMVGVGNVSTTYVHHNDFWMKYLAKYLLRLPRNYSSSGVMNANQISK